MIYFMLKSCASWHLREWSCVISTHNNPDTLIFIFFLHFWLIFLCKRNTVKNATCPSHAYKTFLNLAAQFFFKVCEEKEKERVCAGQTKTVHEEEERGECIFVFFRPPFWLEWLRVCALSVRRTIGKWPQLFSNSERRSSLLLLGRSGGSKYERSSSGFANSGRRSKEGSGMSDPDVSRLLPGVNDRSPWGWLLGVCGCCGCGGCWGGGTCLWGGGPLCTNGCPDWPPGCKECPDWPPGCKECPDWPTGCKECPDWPPGCKECPDWPPGCSGGPDWLPWGEPWSACCSALCGGSLTAEWGIASLMLWERGLSWVIRLLGRSGGWDSWGPGMKSFMEEAPGVPWGKSKLPCPGKLLPGLP